MPRIVKRVRVVAANIIVYTTDYCPYCVQAKQLLKRKSAAYTEVNIEHRPELRTFLIQASGQRTVPQVFINGKSIGGFSDMAALDKKGELDRMLKEPPPPEMPSLPT
jgi:glutaredoxin 3